ncbi:hypothetical protein ETN89_20535 (plasmid) [Photobacterium damselae subsp. damselae]|uniref:hypothetical protein n=1 Tax=Photobacterium damselae TaxID=38293 RepID=UPI000A2F9700|nr:hypothetical protein [Photobacterium damselae]ARR51893.1 hypothetical protein CAY62_21070 [Photobacterium damselae subsp. damselae]QAY37622.1 hypothetical protein ETN89_20535 [Photobacterium damselae subsp. damselae]
MKIDVTTATFQRLSKLAQGFDTPDAVINRLIDEVTKQPEIKPTIIFNPEIEDDFKRKLLNVKLAEVCLHYTDAAPTFSMWNATKFKESSNLKANIWSGFLRGWKNKCITKIELIVLDKDVDLEMLKLAHALGISYDDALKIQPYSHREDDNNYLVCFKNYNEKILSKIAHKVNIDGEVYLPAFMLDN